MIMTIIIMSSIFFLLTSYSSNRIRVSAKVSSVECLQHTLEKAVEMFCQ